MLKTNRREITTRAKTHTMGGKCVRQMRGGYNKVTLSQTERYNKYRDSVEYAEMIGISVNVSDKQINVSENGTRTVSRGSMALVQEKNAAFARRLPAEKPVHRGGCQ
jgi:hypothetical protein